jgi:hypothetical protein
MERATVFNSSRTPYILTIKTYYTSRTPCRTVRTRTVLEYSISAPLRKHYYCTLYNTIPGIGDCTDVGTKRDGISGLKNFLSHLSEPRTL